MRIPLVSQFFSRDGTLGKDAHIKNAYGEMRGKKSALRRRPGVVDKGLIATGAANLLVCWDGLLSIIGTSFSGLILTPGSGVGTYGSDTVDTSGNAVFQLGTSLLGTKVLAAFLDEALEEAKHYYGSHALGFSALNSPNTPSPSYALTRVVTGNSLYVASGFDYTAGAGTESYADRLWKSAISDPPSFSVCLTVTGWFGHTVQFLGGYFVCLFLDGGSPGSWNSRVYWSADAITWSYYQFPLNNYLLETVYDGTYWWFYGSTADSATASAFRTADFVTFSSVTLTGFSGGITKANYAAGVYRANQLSSTDGANFVDDTTLPPVRLLGNNNSVAYAITTGTPYDSIYLLGSSPQLVISVPMQNSYGYFTIDGSATTFVTSSGIADTDVLTIAVGTTEETVTPTPIATIADTAFWAEANGSARSTQQLLLKSAEKLYSYTRTGGLVLVTDIDYPGKHTYTVSSLTRSGTTATVTTSTTNALSTGQTVTIAGATQTEYNGNFVITVTDGTHFTYTVSGSPATPATGTITAYGGKTTVPGIVYLDGYFVVMTPEGVLFNSALGDGTSWDALDFTTAEVEPGDGKAIAKTASYIAALKEWSTEFFYDAGNATGSPFSTVQNAFTLVGCASGESVAYLDEALFFVSQTKEKGRGVHVMHAMEQQSVSTPDVERILTLSDLSEVYAYGLRIAGHSFYILTLVDQDITLVFDLTSKLWGTWSSLTAASPVTLTSLTRSGSVVTCVKSAHGLVDGAPITVSGADQSDYNGTFPITYIDANTFSYYVESSQATTGTGTIQFTAYVESYFKFTRHVQCSGRNFVLHKTNGHLYEILATAEDDAEIPIDVQAITSKLDGESLGSKFQGSLSLVGSNIDSAVIVRWSDDDYTTFSKYRRLSIAEEGTQLRRCGSFRRRAFEVRYIDTPAIELAELEIEVQKG